MTAAPPQRKFSGAMSDLREPEHRQPPPTDPGRADPEWATWDDERLLDLRLCDLGISIRKSKLAGRIRRLHVELAAYGLPFRPHFWLSTEWFCPDGVAGIAMPFCLAHPRLERLERTLLLEVEGDDETDCLRLMRHEAGHAIDNAYGLRRRRRRQQLFGSVSRQQYLDDYLPRPYSRRYVRHLPGWYAQSHPTEDWAESFAVWLDPASDWRRRYAGWPALVKLEYIDELMRELARAPAPVVARRRVEPVGQLRKTLREHYDEKRDRYGIGEDVAYEHELKRIFSAAPQFRGNPPAVRFIRSMRQQVRAQVARWTGVYQYTIDQIIAEIIGRCRRLDLRLAVPPEQARMDFTIALTVQTMKYVHSERHRYLR